MNIPALAFGTVIILLVILAGILAWKATHSDSRFDFASAFLDSDGKTSMTRVGVFTALACSTWAFVYLTLNDKLSEWYFTGYLGAWVLQSIGNKWIENK